MMMVLACENKTSQVKTNTAPMPIGPYSQALIKNNQLFVSGQIGLSATGQLDTSSVENECRQALNNLKNIIEAAGYTMNDVCKTTLYTTDLNNFKTINKVYSDYFSDPPPARETVEVKALPAGARFEISAIAVK